MQPIAAQYMLHLTNSVAGPPLGMQSKRLPPELQRKESNLSGVTWHKTPNKKLCASSGNKLFEAGSPLPFRRLNSRLPSLPSTVCVPRRSPPPQTRSLLAAQTPTCNQPPASNNPRPASPVSLAPINNRNPMETAPPPAPPPPQMDPPSFTPGVTVSALALRNLPHLRYTRFRLSRPSPPPQPAQVAERAKWLEHGVGPQTAYTSSALALLSDALPAALAACVPPSPAPPAKTPADPKPTARRTAPPPPALWVFATAPVLAQAHTLIADTFASEEDGVWTPDAPASHTHALLASLRRAIAAALEGEGALAVADEVLHPESGLSYAFNLSLCAPRSPADVANVLVRVAVRNRFARRLDDDDSALVLAEAQRTPLRVFTSPLGIKGVLARRPMAGDALTASVLKRWREAGLLPSGDLPDSTVVFLRLDDGIEVPFPRACILTTEPKRALAVELGPKKGNSSGSRASTSKTNDQGVNRKQSKSSTGTPRSRKRPRSPSAQADEGATATTKVETKQEVVIDKPDPLALSEERYASNAPTAKSLNSALDLAQKSGASDPVPLLHHPVVDPIPPPSFHIPAETKIEDGKAAPANGTTASETQNSPNAVEKTGGVVERPGGSRTANGTVSNQQSQKQRQSSAVKPSSDPKPSHSANGIDSFLLDGESNTAQEVCGGFDAGPSMDMTDFTAFDDDVTEFFRDGMDDRLPGTENPLSHSEEAGRSAQQNQLESIDRLGDQEASLSQSNSEANRQMRDSHMDVDTELQKVPSDTGGSLLQGGGSRLRAQDVMAMALSTLRKTSHIQRPDDKAVTSQVTSFFEEDLTERRLVRLGVAGAIGKRRSRSKFKGRKSLSRIKDDACSKPQDMSTAGPSAASFYALSAPFSYKIGSGASHKHLSDRYVPRRKLKAFYKLRRQGKAIDLSTALAYSESDDTDASEGEEDGEPVRGDLKRASNVEGLGILPKNALNGSMCEEARDGKREVEAASPKDEDVHEFDPLRIMESVAVDCASACMVLAASRTSRPLTSPFSVDSTSTGPTVAASGTLPLSRDEDSSKGTGTSHVGLKGTQTAISKSHGANQGNSPIGRTAIPNKRDRELLPLLTLLEMQAFSVEELDIFWEADASQRTQRFALRRQEGTSAPDEDSDNVSSSTVRRVLMGLPRVLETSRVFGSCSAAMRDHDNESPSLKVLGPLPVQDILGDSAAIFPLDLPRVCIGYNKNWIEAPSGVLPLWEKAGLEPYSERKNVEYVAVAPKDMENDVRLFLRDVSAAYEECSFGRHAAMPFDAVTFIANSKVKTDQRSRGRTPDLLSGSDKAMTEQYHLAITGLCTKLAAVTREYRKRLNETSTNIVAYIISPFENTETAANVSLLRAVAPLVSSIPGTVSSMVTMLGPNPAGSAVPSAPWRSTPTSKSVVSITVRIIPREVVDRQLSGHAEIECLLERPLRPQLVKAVSFAVFSSIRSKRVRTSHLDGEVAGILPRAALMPDDLLSPMTPEIVAESPGGSTAAPVSPKGGSIDESSGSPISSLASHSAAFLDQSSALSPSFLHEPAIVLSGVGRHMGQTDDRANIVLHLAYTYCESSSRYVFAWTDRRGEVMDIATVPVSRLALGASRRSAFGCMWARGQRWKISYVQEVHVTVCKLGELLDGEIEDWDWVIAKVMQAEVGSTDKRSDEEPSQRVVRRFPPMEQVKAEDISDLYTDHPTPATPGASQTAPSSGGAKGSVSMDIKMPTISSVTVLNVCKANEHLLMEASERAVDEDRRDFAIVSESSLSRGCSVQASAVLGRFEEDGVKAIELNVLRHFGSEAQGEEMVDDRSPWDASSVQSIASSIVMNFHELRYVGSPPSWPSGRWLSIYPVHVDIVRRLEMHVRSVQRFAFASNSSSSK